MKFKKQSIFAAILAVSVMISTSVVVLTDAKNQENVLVTQDFSSVNQIVVSLKNSKFQTKYDKKALLPKINSQIMKELYYSICNNTKNIKKYINPSERYRQESDPKFIISIFYKNGQKDDIRSTETAQFIFKFLDSKGSWTGGSNEKVISSVENIFGVKSVVPTKVPLVVNKTIYKNFNYKYMMNMPSSWVGNYAVCETECGTAFNFVGKSDVSKSFNDDKKTNQGLNMFYIGTKQQMDKFKFYDSSKKIGTINKVDYYYFNQPDYPIGILKSLAKDRKKTVLFVNDTRVVESMQKEIRLMQNDFEIATKMQKDIGDMLKTFRPIQ